MLVHFANDECAALPFTSNFSKRRFGARTLFNKLLLSFSRLAVEKHKYCKTTSVLGHKRFAKSVATPSAKRHAVLNFSKRFSIE